MSTFHIIWTLVKRTFWCEEACWVKFDHAWRIVTPSCLFYFRVVIWAGQQQARVTDMTYWGSLQEADIDSHAILHTLNTLMHTNSYTSIAQQNNNKKSYQHTICNVHPVGISWQIYKIMHIFFWQHRVFSQIAVRWSLLYCELRQSVETLYSKHDRPVGALWGGLWIIRCRNPEAK